jgi:hypothetical protein
MNDRDTFLKDFRGETIGSISTVSSVEETFQNKVLRPILKRFIRGFFFELYYKV